MQPFIRLIFIVSFIVETATCSAMSDGTALAIPLAVGVTEVKKVVSQTCGYMIGLSFSPKTGGVYTIRDIFGPPTAVNLPVEVNVRITDSEGTEIFAIEQFGGRGRNYYYGPPIKFIAGVRQLTPGTYSVRVELTKVAVSMSAFESHIFIDRPPKTICGR